MSALHRLKAYFGMVPAEEFDAAVFDPMEFDPREFDPEGFPAAEFDNYRQGVRAGRSASGHNNHGYDSGFDSRFEDSGFEDSGFDRAATIGTCHTRSPSWVAGARAMGSGFTGSRAMGSRAAGSRAADSWTAETAVRGSLAIDTATINAGPINPSLMGHHPAAPQRVTPVPGTGSPTEDPFIENSAHPLARIVTLHPHNYNEARPIGERYREGNPVIINLTEMADRDAKRLVDFAAGLAFALRGSIDKVTNKVFLLSPPNVDVSAEDRRRIAEGRFFT